MHVHMYLYKVIASIYSVEQLIAYILVHNTSIVHLLATLMHRDTTPTYYYATIVISINGDYTHIFGLTKCILIFDYPLNSSLHIALVVSSGLNQCTSTPARVG